MLVSWLWWEIKVLVLGFCYSARWLPWLLSNNSTGFWSNKLNSLNKLEKDSDSRKFSYSMKSFKRRFFGGAYYASLNSSKFYYLWSINRILRIIFIIILIFGSFSWSFSILSGGIIIRVWKFIIIILWKILISRVTTIIYGRGDVVHCRLTNINNFYFFWF